ncbi:DUF3072 domain-containing protein [Oceaniglobus ichthyenteri]|uniref:DUF3072 domain-containing protein n=1 Tax=Oceaniglobus ichthyenteri TaxID=2136177 RepID=UPI000D33D1D9|nr:DUF3072 domain-containing protein [Oceaniglobus ichthyenteri]
MPKEEKPAVAPGHPVGGIPAADHGEPEPMTEKQAALLRNLCDRAGEPFDTALSRRQAQARIDALRVKLDLE